MSVKYFRIYNDYEVKGKEVDLLYNSREIKPSEAEVVVDTIEKEEKEFKSSVEIKQVNENKIIQQGCICLNDKDEDLYKELDLIGPILLTNSKKSGFLNDQNNFNKYLKSLPVPFYIIYRNSKALHQNYRNIIYKRLTPVNDINMYELFHENWKNEEKGIKNKFNEDFELYSDINLSVSNVHFRKIKVYTKEETHLEIGEIQVWINGINVLQNKGTSVDSSPTHNPTFKKSNVIDNDVNADKHNKSFFGTNTPDSFLTVTLDKNYQFDILEGVIIYQVTWGDWDRFNKSYFVLLDENDNEITDEISNNDKNKIYYYYKYAGPSHNNNKDQIGFRSNEKMMKDGVEKLKKFNLSLSNKKWKYCNFNKDNVGFPFECGLDDKVKNQWISINSDNRGWNFEDWSFSLAFPNNYKVKLPDSYLSIKNRSEGVIEDETDQSIDEYYNCLPSILFLIFVVIGIIIVVTYLILNPSEIQA